MKLPDLRCNRLEVELEETSMEAFRLQLRCYSMERFVYVPLLLYFLSSLNGPANVSS